ncbi:MAG TPA: ribokinase, partial [Anaerolineales bacterium]|nr:ribokinase [Anaerolineales bacterium]
AVAAARLGSNVSMLGRVGQDSFGDFLIDNLKSSDVDSQFVQRDDASTGTAIIVVDENGQNSIVLSAGANGKVSIADAERASFPDFDLLLLQLEIPTPTVLSTTKLAKENGVRIILNPAPAKELPNELISLVDYIIPNETELSLLTKTEVNDTSSAERAAKLLLDRGSQNVIVTLGSNGALIVTQKSSKHIPSFKVDVVDTTAAGDAFIGGFATKLLEPASLLNAVRYGCACGTLATTKFGAQPSLPTKEEVEKLVRAQRAKNRLDD